MISLGLVVTYKKGFKWTSVIITLAQGVKTVRKAQIRLDFWIGNYIIEWKIVQQVLKAGIFPLRAKRVGR